MDNFIALPNIVGNSNATQTTVNLFNTLRPIRRDAKGRYWVTAVKPYLNGVITKKEYI